MALQNFVGDGMWMPTLPQGYNATNFISSSDAGLLDADEEEFQIIGAVKIDGGGSKTFGTSGSKVSWLSGAAITFLTGSTLTVGVKKDASIDTANGPAARATIGAAAFDVYKALLGGTDTIGSTSWFDTAMASGTPFTVADGDLIAICFHLDTTSGTPSVKIRTSLVGTSMGFPVSTLVTSGPTYTAQGLMPNMVLTFDDGTLGWIVPTLPFSVADVATGTIGQNNIFANVFRVPFSCKVDAIAVTTNVGANNRDFALELYSTPLGTPSLIESVSYDANIVAVVGSTRFFVRNLTTPRTLSINTDYAVGMKQTTANAVSVIQRDVNDANHFKAGGMGAECYAANSTAGATFSAQNSGKRRYNIWVRICALDDGVSAGGTTIAGTTMRRGMVG